METKNQEEKKPVRKKRVIPEADPELWEEFVVTRDERLREKLIIHYQGFVYATAKMVGRRIGWKVSQEELISHGQLGLLKAVEGYDPDRGAFKKYASTYVFGAMIDPLRRADWLPRKYRAAQKEIQRAGDLLGDASTKEFADHLGWDEDFVIEVLVNTIRAEIKPIHPQIEVSERLDGGHDIMMVFLDAFDKLSFTQQLILTMRYYGKIPLADVAERLPGVLVSEEHNKAVVLVFREVHEAITGD